MLYFWTASLISAELLLLNYGFAIDDIYGCAVKYEHVYIYNITKSRVAMIYF